MNILCKHRMLVKVIDMTLNITTKKMEGNVFSRDVINNINLLISTLVMLNDNMKPILIQNNRLAENVEELAKYFEDIVYCYEKNEGEEIKEVFIKQLNPKFKRVYKDLNRYFFNVIKTKRL